MRCPKGHKMKPISATCSCDLRSKFNDYCSSWAKCGVCLDGLPTDARQMGTVQHCCRDGCEKFYHEACMKGTIVMCPKKHKLVLSADVTRSHHKICNLCEKRFSRGVRVWGCRSCDFDACSACMTQASRDQNVGPRRSSSSTSSEMTVERITIRQVERRSRKIPKKRRPPAYLSAPISRSWSCHACTFLNKPSSRACEMCETVRDTRSLSEEQALFERDWDTFSSNPASPENPFARHPEVGLLPENGGLVSIVGPKKTEEKEEDPKTECVVCMEKKKTHCLNPCGHFAYCGDCAKKLDHCAIYRKKIVSAIKIFV